MQRCSIYSNALIVCAALILTLSLGCSSSTKSTTASATAPKFLYTSNCGGTSTGSISGFAIDATTGALTPLAGSPFAVGLDCPSVMTTDLTQKWLFVPDENANLIHVYSIGSAGALTEVSGSPYSQCAFQLAIDPSAKFLIAPDFCHANIAVYAIGPDGSLTAVTGSPFSGISMINPIGVGIDPGGKWVYVANDASTSSISVFSLSSAGTLMEVSGSPFAAGSGAYALSVTPNGKYLYSNDYSTSSGQILAYSVSATTGALTPLAARNYAGGDCWNSIDSSGTILFSTDCRGNVFFSTINSNGSLTPATGSPLATEGSPYMLAADPSGAFVYSADESSVGQIFSFGYSSTGALTAVAGSPFASGQYGNGIVVTH